MASPFPQFAYNMTALLHILSLSLSITKAATCTVLPFGRLLCRNCFFNNRYKTKMFNKFLPYVNIKTITSNSKEKSRFLFENFHIFSS